MYLVSTLHTGLHKDTDHSIIGDEVNLLHSAVEVPLFKMSTSTHTSLMMWTPGIPFITIKLAPLPSGELKLVISAANPTVSAGL
jgi:hypothetical protein